MVTTGIPLLKPAVPGPTHEDGLRAECVRLVRSEDRDRQLAHADRVAAVWPTERVPGPPPGAGTHRRLAGAWKAHDAAPLPVRARAARRPQAAPGAGVGLGRESAVLAM